MAFPSIQHQKEEEEEQECDHSFILKEDIGYVCRVCGVVDRSIESIIEFQRPKVLIQNSKLYIFQFNNYETIVIDLKFQYRHQRVQELIITKGDLTKGRQVALFLME